MSESSPSPPFIAQSPRRLGWMLWAALAALGVLAAVLVLVNLAAAHRSHAVETTPPLVTWAAGKRRAPAFVLTDQHRQPVSLDAYRGRPVLVTFIDPLCRNFCPLEAKQLNNVVRELPTAQRPAIVAVSVNVYGNTQKNLLEDEVKWQLVPQWRWAVGPPRQLASVWRNYQVGVQVTTRRIAGITVHEVSHTEAAYLIDGQGYERAVFLWPFRAIDVRAALAKLTAST